MSTGCEILETSSSVTAKTDKRSDRWGLTVMALQGQPWPAPPALPGRLHVCQDDPDPPGLPDWAHLPAAELARRLGVTRQAAHARLKKVRAQIVNHVDQAEGSAPD